MPVCAEGETVQATRNCPFSINTLPYVYTHLAHFEFPLQTPPLTADTRRRASTAAVMCITE